MRTSDDSCEIIMYKCKKNYSIRRKNKIEHEYIRHAVNNKSKRTDKISQRVNKN